MTLELLGHTVSKNSTPPPPPLPTELIASCKFKTPIPSAGVSGSHQLLSLIHSPCGEILRLLYMPFSTATLRSSYGDVNGVLLSRMPSKHSTMPRYLSTQMSKQLLLSHATSQAQPWVPANGNHLPSSLGSYHTNSSTALLTPSSWPSVP